MRPPWTNSATQMLLKAIGLPPSALQINAPLLPLLLCRAIHPFHSPLVCWGISLLREPLLLQHRSPRAFHLMPYMQALKATAMPYHFLFVIFVEALIQMGWSEFNSTLGFKIPEVQSGERPICIHCLGSSIISCMTFCHPGCSFQALPPSRATCHTGALPSIPGSAVGTSSKPSWTTRREATALRTRSIILPCVRDSARSRSSPPP